MVLLASSAVAILSSCSTADESAAFAGDPSRPITVPPTKSKRPKILAFGDSLTAGFGLAQNESYPYLLQKRLDADGFEYEVVDAGLSGDTTVGGLDRIDWVLEGDGISIMILELGGNDLLRRMPVENMRRNLEVMIEKAQAKNIKVLLCGMLAPPGLGVRYQRDFQMTFPDLAEKYDLEFLPFILEGVAAKKELNQADGIHPNAEGAKIMTENVYTALKPLLEKGK